MRSETFDQTRARMAQNDVIGEALGDAAWEQGRRLTPEAQQALNQNSRWGSDSYPVRKLGRKWIVEHPAVSDSPLFTRQRDAVNFWEVQLAQWRRLAGLAAHQRALAAVARAEAPPVGDHAIPLHFVRAWSGVPEDESPVCGADRQASNVWGYRTQFVRNVTCPSCRQRLGLDSQEARDGRGVNVQ